MKCNYQSWRSQHDGIPFPPRPPARSTPARCNLPPTRYPPPSRSSSTLAHNLYYGRGAHIINLIKRSALKIVLLVRQLLTAVTFLSPSFPPAFRPFSFVLLPSPVSLSRQFLPFILPTAIRSLGRVLVILTLSVRYFATRARRFFNAVSVNTTLRFSLFVSPCASRIWSRFSAP